MSGKSQGFLLPSEIRDVPGTEGWESMYPYFTRFRPEDDKVFWFYNAMHFPEPMPAFDVLTAEVPYQALGAFTTRVFSFPTTLGIDHRIVNGRIYITAYPVTDPKEIQRRLALFQERAGHYFQNWNKLYEEWKGRMLALIKEVEDIKVPSLPEFDDIEVVTSARGIGQNHYIREQYHRCIEAFSKMWHHHFEFLMLGYGAYLVFFEFCKKAFPEISDQTVARMVAGIDVFMFRPDEELKKLARLAVELKLDGKFGDGSKPADTLAALGQMGEPGKRWLDALEKTRDPWFLMSTGDGFYHHHRSWNDDLSVPFSAIARYIDMLKAGQSIERPTERLKAERERIIAEYRGLLSSDEERGAFDQMLGLCHLVFPFVEDHKFYCEHWFTTLWFNKLREFGALLARFGVVADAEDFFHLHHTEADLALQEVSLAWASGGGPCRPRLLEADPQGAQTHLGKAEGLVAAARARPHSRRHRRSCAADAVGDHFRDDRGLGAQARRGERTRVARLRGFARRGGGRRAGAEERQRHRPDAGRRDPYLPGHQPELGPGVRQDQGDGLRHWRHDVACGHRRTRIRHAGGGRNRGRDEAHQDRAARSRRRQHRRRHHSRLRRHGMTGSALSLAFTDIGIGDRPDGRGQGREPRRTDQGRDPRAAGFRRHDCGLRSLHC